MLLGVHNFYDSFCACIVTAGSALMFCKTTFGICRYTGIERAIFALKQIDKIHVLKIAHFAVKKIYVLAAWYDVEAKTGIPDTLFS